MRRLASSLAAALVGAVLAPAAAASDEDGGAAAPRERDGGTAYGEPLPPPEPSPAEDGAARDRARHAPAPSERNRSRRRRAGAPLLSSFVVTRPKLFLMGRPARVRFRIEGRSPKVRVRLHLIRPGARAPVRTIEFGERPTGVMQSVPLTGREGGTLPQGRYVLRISGQDVRGRRLRRAPSASVAQHLAFFHHRFPVAGPFTYGGPDARFGAGRRGHRHQGQDLLAAEGTPVVAPRGGVVEAVKHQRDGAGHYVVVDGDREDRDYVFMHLREGSIPVREGQRVRTGQRLGEVGSTGRSSAPHLHFEIWVDGGWQTGGHPIDPLRSLRAWKRWS